MPTLSDLMPSPGELFASIVFGLVGLAGWRYGKKHEHWVPKAIGVALMVYPYAVSGVWLLWGIGAVLSVALVMLRDRG